MNVLVIIPARGGSKGIPRKNLRSMNGKPLIAYAIETGLKSAFKPDVYVSSDDEEILMVARKVGASVHRRNAELANDKATLDPVILDACETIEKETGKRYDVIATMQPTSPLLKVESLDTALAKFVESPELETVMSARKEAHLSWRMENEKFVPNYKARVNRQYLDPTYYETGAFIICRREVMEKKASRIGEKVDLQVLSETETTDIDTYSDWNLCEYLLRRKTILFVTVGYNEIGMGHVYRSLLLANNILNHRLVFLTLAGSDLAYDKIKENNYEVYKMEHRDVIDDIAMINPDIVINDILDTGASYIQTLREKGICVINFEDLGPGAKKANLVINELYPENENLPNHFFGHRYFCSRDEFLLSDYKRVNKDVKRVLITMGGTDPSDLTLKVLSAVYGYCLKKKIAIDVVMGLGYQKEGELANYPGIGIHRNIGTMSDFMLNADLIFTSAGRTVYEAACIGTPTIVMGQNKREMTHLFASAENGFINLGLGSEVPPARLSETFDKFVTDYEARLEASRLMKSKEIRRGRNRVIRLIQQAIDDHTPLKKLNSNAPLQTADVLTAKGAL